MKRVISLLLTLFWFSLAMTLAGQECADGTNVIRHRTSVSLAKVNSHPGGRWSSTKARLPKGMVITTASRGTSWANPFQGSGRRSSSPDFPLERCAILAFTGVGIGFLAEDQSMAWKVGAPAVVVATALPFPGQARQGQFASRRKIGQKALGFLAMTVSYAVGMGIGQNLHMDSPN